jgi:hypothetical protein
MEAIGKAAEGNGADGKSGRKEGADSSPENGSDFPEWGPISVATGGRPTLLGGGGGGGLRASRLISQETHVAMPQRVGDPMREKSRESGPIRAPRDAARASCLPFVQATAFLSGNALPTR